VPRVTTRQVCFDIVCGLLGEGAAGRPGRRSRLVESIGRGGAGAERPVAVPLSPACAAIRGIAGVFGRNRAGGSPNLRSSPSLGSLILDIVSAVQ
jgi:hypothetical protein